MKGRTFISLFNVVEDFENDQQNATLVQTDSSLCARDQRITYTICRGEAMNAPVLASIYYPGAHGWSRHHINAEGTGTKVNTLARLVSLTLAFLSLNRLLFCNEGNLWVLFKAFLYLIRI